MEEKVKIMHSFGHKFSIYHNLNLASNKKSSFSKVLKFTNLNEDMGKKVKIMQSFGRKCKYRHNLNEGSNHYNSLIKVLKLTNLNEGKDKKSKLFSYLVSKDLFSLNPNQQIRDEISHFLSKGPTTW